MPEFDNQGSDLILLVSLPRSGSTLLQRILAGHSSIHTTAEPWLMLHPLYALRDGAHTAEYDATLARQGLEDFLAQFDDGRTVYLESIRNWGAELYGKALCQSGKSVFLDKTPRYYHILPELREVFPQAKFVFLLRNPMAVLASTLKTWFENEPSRLAGTSNYTDLTHGARCLADGLELFGDQATVVRYEDLVSAPQQTIEHLCGSIGLDFEVAMLEYGRFPAPQGRHGDQDGINRHTHAVSDYLDCWKDSLKTPEHRDFARDYLQQLGSECLTRLGYDFAAIEQVLSEEVASSLGSSGNCRHQPADSLTAEGEQLYLAGDIEGAKRRFEQALVEDPDFVLAHNDLAVLYWQQHDPERAVIELKEGLSRHPGHRDLTITAGQIFSALGMERNAAELYQAYLSDNPDDQEILLLDASLAADIPAVDSVGAVVLPVADDAAAQSESDCRPAATTPITIITSIAPKGLQKQRRAVQSWLDLGFEVLSLNIQKEIEILLPDFPGVTFIRAKRDGSKIANKPYVYIDDMLAELKRTGHQVVGIVNSDIILRAQASLVEYLNEEAVGSFLYASRIDVEKPDDKHGKVYHRGFDLFFFDRAMIDKIPKSKFMLGMPWWDYWVPLAPLLQEMPVKRIETPLGFHVWHATNYSDAQLMQFAREFASQCEQAPFIDLFRQCVEGNYGSVRYSVLSDAALDYLARNSERVYLPQTVTDTSYHRSERKDKPRVTAIVSTYNSEAFIDGCLRNLVSQTIADQIEIIVIDAASTQNEWSIVERYQKCHSNIRYHRTPERIGVYAAWNLVVRMARGDYLITCSTNDRLREDTCEILARTLDEQTDVALVYGNSFLSKVPRQAFDAPTICGLYVWPEYSYELLLDRCMVGPHPMWRRSVHRDIGYFDETLVALADQEFWLRLGENHRLLNIPDFTGLYHVSEDSITGDTDLTQIEVDRVHADYSWRYRYARWFPKRYASDEARDNDGRPLQAGPSMQIIVIMGSGNAEALADTLDSVAAQLYPGWKLTVISESACPDPLFQQEERLHWVQRSLAVPLGDELNRVTAAARADWVAAIEAGERLDPAFLSDACAYLEKYRDWKLIYFDDDEADAQGNLSSPRFKPDMNLELLRSSAYIGDACLFNREAAEAAGGFTGQDYALLYDLVLRMHDSYGVKSIGHVADIRFHRTGAQSLPTEEISIEHRRAALQQHLLRCGDRAVIQDAMIPGCFKLEYQPQALSKVSILISAMETGNYLIDCLQSVLAKTRYPDYEVRVLMAPGKETPTVRQLYAVANGDNRVTIVPAVPGRSDNLNSLASAATGKYLLWLNQDTVILQEEWLTRLVGCCAGASVGIVGARVVNRRKTLVSGGVITGIGGRGVGGRCNEDLHMLSPGYMGRAQLDQEMDAVPSLCMLVDKELYVESGGFDPQLSITLYHDIDLCQHVRKKGRRIIWTASVTVMYLAERRQVDGVVSSNKQVEDQVKVLHQRWLKDIAKSPGYNRNFSALRGDYTLETDRVRGWDPEIDNKPRILTYGTGSYGSWQYRVRQPMNVMQDQGVLRVTHTPFVGSKITSLPSVAEIERLQPTALLMHNTMHDDFIRSMQAYKQVNNAFIVFGQDDLMAALPPKNPFARTVYKDVKKRLRKCLSLADRLVVTTEPLAHALGDMVGDIRVIPNYLDETVWNGLQSMRHAGAKPRVGWAGAQQHLGDLELLEEVVRETASRVDWIFFGMCPQFLRPYAKEVHDAVEFECYPDRLAQLNLDVALAPLEHNRFNEAKSNLRLLEYGILGWAVIASDIQPYREAPVCRVPNQARAWINAIRERIEELESTWTEGDRLRDWVRANWFLQQNIEQWAVALDPASSAVTQCRDRNRAAGL